MSRTHAGRPCRAWFWFCAGDTSSTVMPLPRGQARQAGACTIPAVRAELPVLRAALAVTRQGASQHRFLVGPALRPTQRAREQGYRQQPVACGIPAAGAVAPSPGCGPSA
eukprot:2239032-Prymnesium_polylepis.1